MIRSVTFAFVVVAALAACRQTSQADVERARAEAEKAKAEAEKAKAEAERARAEADKARAEHPRPLPATAPVPTIANGTGATITVAVSDTKANGKPWDAAGGAPDIALCVTSSRGTTCLPDGTNIGSITRPMCRDALTCTFHLDIPDEEVSLDIVDVDVAANDTIGVGTCTKGRACTVGQATVSIR